MSERKLDVAKQAALEAKGRAEQAEADLAEVEQALKLQLEETNQKLKVSQGRAVAVQTALVEHQAQAQPKGCSHQGHRRLEQPSKRPWAGQRRLQRPYRT